MKRILIPVAFAASLIGSTAMAADPRVCSIVADIGGNAAMMRQAGATQHETARAGADYFSRFINSPEVRKSFTNEQRHAMADAWGRTATKIVQTVYSLPIEKTPEKKAIAVEATAKWAYDTCARSQ